MYEVSQPIPEALTFRGAGLSTPSLASADLQALRWYAVYTRSRHEKCVSRQLEGKSFEYFLPTCESLHRWNDRNAVVSLPLFPNYLFVRIRLADRMQIVTVSGVVTVVGVHGRPSPIPDEEIETLRTCFARHIRMEPHPYLAVGRRVRVIQGPFAEAEGILLRRKGRFRLVLSVNLIARSVAVEVDANDVVPA
jgi:transcription antitermination factor NusG